MGYAPCKPFESARSGAQIKGEIKTVECLYCGEEIEDGQPKVFDGGDWFHLYCSISERDAQLIDAEHE